VATRSRGPTPSRNSTRTSLWKAPVGSVVTVVSPMPGDHVSVTSVSGGKSTPVAATTTPGGPSAGATVKMGGLVTGGNGGIGGGEVRAAQGTVKMAPARIRPMALPLENTVCEARTRYEFAGRLVTKMVVRNEPMRSGETVVIVLPSKAMGTEPPPEDGELGDGGGLNLRPNTLMA
jgi:hypothetical protein